MDFDFTEDQNSLRDAVRRYVDKDYGFDQRRAIVKAGGFSREAWNALAGLGLTALAVPEAHGGIGVTDEYIGSHYFKRLAVMEMQYGDSLHHLGEVSARMQDTAGVFA